MQIESVFGGFILKAHRRRTMRLAKVKDKVTTRVGTSLDPSEAILAVATSTEMRSDVVEPGGRTLLHDIDDGGDFATDVYTARAVEWTDGGDFFGRVRIG
jgi:hypothetical protein